jgi:hypothetical protein
MANICCIAITHINKMKSRPVLLESPPLPSLWCGLLADDRYVDGLMPGISYLIETEVKDSIIISIVYDRRRHVWEACRRNRKSPRVVVRR